MGRADLRARARALTLAKSPDLVDSTRRKRVPSPTPDVLQEELDLVDCEGLDFFGEAKESARV